MTEDEIKKLKKGDKFNYNGKQIEFIERYAIIWIKAVNLANGDKWGFQQTDLIGKDVALVQLDEKQDDNNHHLCGQCSYHMISYCCINPDTINRSGFLPACRFFKTIKKSDDNTKQLEHDGYTSSME